MHRIAMLGSGLVATFYAEALHGQRRQDRIQVVYSRSLERARDFAARWKIPRYTSDVQEAIESSDSNVVVVALPNHLHESAVTAAAKAGKPVLCTKPLGRNAQEALRMLTVAEEAGVFHGYLEDLCYTPKTLKALKAVQEGLIGKVLSVRSREAHSGPHKEWFSAKQFSGGGVLIDLGCHCVEIARTFIGKHIRPIEVSCWGDTQVHSMEVEDCAIGLIRFENGAIGQFEVSWAFCGGMDLRDEVVGTKGTIWLNHWLRTGMEMYVAARPDGNDGETHIDASGWLFPVGDESSSLGCSDMFSNMFDALDLGTSPNETFFDGYVVNTILDAAYLSMKRKCWQPIDPQIWPMTVTREQA